MRGRAGCATSVPGQPYKNKQISLVCTIEQGKMSKLYINGKLMGENNQSTSSIPYGNLEIGRSLNNADRYWLGTISGFMVYTSILSEEEIAQNYRANSLRFALDNV